MYAEFIGKYLAKRPDPSEYEAYINEQMEAFEEREKKVYCHIKHRLNPA